MERKQTPTFAGKIITSDRGNVGSAVSILDIPTSLVLARRRAMADDGAGPSRSGASGAVPPDSARPQATGAISFGPYLFAPN
jgi:hypothetical protein